MQIVTEEFLDLGVNKDKDINESQLVLLDVELNQKEQWREASLGKQLSDARAELYVLLKGIKAISTRKSLISNYKTLQKFRQDKKTPEEVKPQNPSTKKELPPQKGDVTIYCDGGCTPNPGKSGSGVAIYRDNKLSELWYGLYEKMGTNNTAELGALYESLLIAQREAQKGNRVTIKCDSMYSINCIKTWAISWEKKGWTKKGGEIKNLEIIKLAYHLYNAIKHQVELTHIKAHAGYEGNELADRMTMYAIEEKSEAFVKYDDPIDVNKILQMRAG